MVDIFGYQLDLAAGGAQAVNIVYILCALVIVAGIAYYIYFISQFKIKYRVREVIKGRKVVFDDKARVFRDSDGIEWWQLLQKKVKIPIPPADAIEINAKGQKCVEAYLTATGDYVYIIDDTNELDKVEEDWTQIKDSSTGKIINQKTKALKFFKPFPTEQRLIMIQQYRKALDRRKKQLSDYLLPIVAIGALVVIVLALMIFYGDMAKPLLEMGDKQVAIQKSQQDMMDRLTDMLGIYMQLDKNQSITLQPKPPS